MKRKNTEAAEEFFKMIKTADPLVKSSSSNSSSGGSSNNSNSNSSSGSSIIINNIDNNNDNNNNNSSKKEEVDPAEYTYFIEKYLGYSNPYDSPQLDGIRPEEIKGFDYIKVEVDSCREKVYFNRGENFDRRTGEIFISSVGNLLVYVGEFKDLRKSMIFRVLRQQNLGYKNFVYVNLKFGDFIRLKNCYNGRYDHFKNVKIHNIFEGAKISKNYWDIEHQRGNLLKFYVDEEQFITFPFFTLAAHFNYINNFIKENILGRNIVSNVLIERKINADDFEVVKKIYEMIKCCFSSDVIIKTEYSNINFKLIVKFFKFLKEYEFYDLDICVKNFLSSIWNMNKNIPIIFKMDLLCILLDNNDIFKLNKIENVFKTNFFVRILKYDKIKLFKNFSIFYIDNFVTDIKMKGKLGKYINNMMKNNNRR